MNRKILHLSTVHVADDLRIFQKEVRSLRALGWEVVVAGIRSPHPPDDLAPAHIFEPAKSPGKRMLTTIPRVVEVVKEQRPWLLHFHDPEILAAVPFVRRYCERIVYDSHEHISEQTRNKPYIPAMLRPLASSVVGAAEALLLRNIDAVVSPTPHIAAHFRALGKPVAMVANYPDQAYLPEFADPATRKSQAVYTGALAEARGLDTMLAAASEIGAELHLAGKVTAQRRNLLEEAAQGKNIHYHGWMSRADCLNLQCESMVGLQLQMPLPQYMTAIPTKVFEYLSMGLIVICSDLPFLRELFAGFSTIRFIDPADARQLSVAWRAALEDYPRMTEDLRASRKKVLEEFTWESQVSELESLYRRLDHQLPERSDSAH